MMIKACCTELSLLFTLPAKEHNEAGERKFSYLHRQGNEHTRSCEDPLFNCLSVFSLLNTRLKCRSICSPFTAGCLSIHSLLPAWPSTAPPFTPIQELAFTRVCIGDRSPNCLHTSLLQVRHVQETGEVMQNYQVYWLPKVALIPIIRVQKPNAVLDDRVL
jgi:hypothetical protein